MATFVDLVDEEAGVPFVYQHLSNLLGKEHKIAAQVAALASQKKFIEAFNQFVAGCLDELLEKTAPAKDVDACWTVLCSSLRKQSKSEHSAYLEAIRNSAAKLSSNSDSKPVLRIKLLTTLLNSIESSKGSAHFEVYVTILRFSRDSKRPDRVIKYVNDVDSLLDEWKVDRNSERARMVYGLIYDILSTPSATTQPLGVNPPPFSASRAHQFHRKYLATFPASIENFDQAVIEQHAVKVVLDAIKIPDVWQYDELLELRPVVALKQDPKYTKVFDLLTIATEKYLADYIQFYAENKEYIDSLSGISHNEIVDKMRILTLCSLAFSKHPIDYSTIATALQVAENDVERWVIRAISLKLVDAEIDQIARSITFSRSTHRVFSRAQWETLARKLDSWKESLRMLSQMVHTAKTEQHRRD